MNTRKVPCKRAHTRNKKVKRARKESTEKCGLEEREGDGDGVDQ